MGMKRMINLFICSLISLFFTTNVLAADASDYKSLNDALRKAKEGDTVKLTHDISLSENQYISVSNDGSKAKKNITLDFQGHTINSTSASKATIIVTDDVTLTITGNGTVNSGDQTALIVKDGDVIIENGTFTVSTAPYYAIHVGDGNGDSIDERERDDLTNTLTIKNATITNTQSGGIMVMTRHSVLDIENVNLTATDNTAISTYKTTVDVTINIKGGNLSAKASTKEQVDGIGIVGQNINLNISGGTLEALNGIGINSNNSKGNTSTIKISGGHIKAHTGMYQPELADTTISGGTIEGVIGIVARQGVINITGGTIIGSATSSDESYAVGYKDHFLTPGVSIAVDNEPTTYGADLVVNISGGIFSATADNAIESYQKNNTDFKITGGEFNKEFNANFIDGEAKVQIGSSYFVGASAKEALEKAPSGTTATVLQGSIDFTNVSGGVTVVNLSDGNVTVNGQKIEQGNSITIPVPSHSTTTPEEPKEEPKEIVTDVVYEDNGDGLVIEGSIITENNEPSLELAKVYDEMVEYVASKGFTEIFNMYEFHVKDNNNLTHALTITFNIGESNNGKLAYILHQKHDGTYEEFEKEVKDGKVDITVSELSPFVVALKENILDVDSDIGVENPKTRDVGIIGYGLLSSFTIFMTSIVLAKKEEV